MPDVPHEWIDTLRGGGVVRLGASDVADSDLESWAATTDRAVLTLDTQDCSTESELLATLGAVFGLDEDTDAEWDTIDDCLADYDVGPAGGLVIVWTGWDGLDEDAEDAMPTAVDAFATAAQTWTDEGRPWAVLVVGDGPSWQLPWLGAGPPPWEDDAADLDELGDAEDDDDEEWDTDDAEISDESYTFDEERAGDPVSPW